MTAPDFLTWTGDEDNAPRRPSTDDLGGDQKQNHARYLPNPTTQPTAEGWNQQVKQIAAHSQVVDAARIDVDFTAGVPAVVAVASPSPSITTDSFELTDEGTGIVLIEWEPDLMPPAQIAPRGPFIRSALTTRCEGHIEPVTNGVRVRLFSNGTVADLNFSIDIHGS
jgi:hypothetical protein